MSDDSSEAPAFNSVDAYYAVARALQTNKSYQRALVYLALALKQDEKHTPSLLLRSRCYMALCETEKALIDVKAVLKLEPKNPHALLLLGEIHYLRGDFEEALTTFHRGRILRPTIEHFQLGIHKCEMAIDNSCENCQIHLVPDVNLTEYYVKAFPPKRPGRNQQSLVQMRPENANEGISPWPRNQPKEMQQKLLNKGYVDFCYLEDIYETEDDRVKALSKLRPDALPDMPATVDRSKENRQTAVECGNFLDRHAELYLKFDPGLRNTNKGV